MAENIDKSDDFDTRAVRAGTLRTPFNEHSEAVFLTSSFVFENAAQAAERFSGAEDGYVYSRFTNPTVRMFEQRLASLEGAEDCIATASGMSAIMAACLATLKSGDHVVCAASVFGATVQLFSTLLARFGIDVSFVDAASPSALALGGLQSHTAALLRNAVQSADGDHRPGRAGRARSRHRRADIGRQLLLHSGAAASAGIRRRRVIHSATKYLDGQGRVLGGAVLGSRRFVREQVLPVLRTTGPCLSPFNAWVLLKGLETLSVRMRAQSAAALELARWLERHPAVKRVYFPGLASHPQAQLCARQQTMAGAVIGLEVARRRARGGARAGLVGDRPGPADVDHRQPRRHADDDHPSGDDHARSHRRKPASVPAYGKA